MSVMHETRKIKKIDYDEEVDILSIDADHADYKYSIDLGKVIVDFDGNPGRVSKPSRALAPVGKAYLRQRGSFGWKPWKGASPPHAQFRC